MPDSHCKHARTRLIAKDDDSQYFECLECGGIFEASEFTRDSDSDTGSSTKVEPDGGGSLSDA